MIPSRSRRARLRQLLAVVPLVVIGVTAAACSSSINVASLESEVSAQLAVQQEVPASEVSVDCPEPIEVGQGAVTRCTATIAGESADIDVTQMDGEGRVEWVIVETTDAPGS